MLFFSFALIMPTFAGLGQAAGSGKTFLLVWGQGLAREGNFFGKKSRKKMYLVVECYRSKVTKGLLKNVKITSYLLILINVNINAF